MFSAFVQDFDSELSLKAEQELKKRESVMIDGDDAEVFEGESGLYTAINEYLAAIGHPYFFL